MLKKIMLITVALLVSLGLFASSGLPAENNGLALAQPTPTPKPTPCPTVKDADLNKLVMDKLKTALSLTPAPGSSVVLVDTATRVKVHISTKQGIVTIQGFAQSADTTQPDKARFGIINTAMNAHPCAVKGVNFNNLANIVGGGTCDGERVLCQGLCVKAGTC